MVKNHIIFFVFMLSNSALLADVGIELSLKNGVVHEGELLSYNETEIRIKSEKLTMPLWNGKETPVTRNTYKISIEYEKISQIKIGQSVQTAPLSKDILAQLIESENPTPEIIEDSTNLSTAIEQNDTAETFVTFTQLRSLNNRIDILEVMVKENIKDQGNYYYDNYSRRKGRIISITTGIGLLTLGVFDIIERGVAIGNWNDNDYDNDYGIDYDIDYDIEVPWNLKVGIVIDGAVILTAIILISNGVSK